MEVNNLGNAARNSALNDPVLRYQLDPGEPGLLRSAPASQSIAAVSAQERGNLNQFRREAFQAGRLVIYTSITFTRAIDGNFPSVRAGKTEVVSIPMPSFNNGVEIVNEPDGALSKTIEELNNPAEPPTETIPPTADQEEPVNGEQIQLLARLTSLKTEIELEKTSLANPGGELFTIPEELTILQLLEPPTVASDGEPINKGIEPGPETIQAELKMPELTLPEEKPGAEMAPSIKTDDITAKEQQAMEISRKLNDLQIAALQARIESINELMISTINTNLKLLSHIIQVANRVGPNVHISDLSGVVPLLGSTLDRTV